MDEGDLDTESESSTCENTRIQSSPSFRLSGHTTSLTIVPMDEREFGFHDPLKTRLTNGCFSQLSSFQTSHFVRILTNDVELYGETTDLQSHAIGFHIAIDSDDLSIDRGCINAKIQVKLSTSPGQTAGSLLSLSPGWKGQDRTTALF